MKWVFNTYNSIAPKFNSTRLYIWPCVKTFINSELLSDDQIKQFYGSSMISMLPLEYTTEKISGADFIIENEELLPQKPQDFP